jgi:predicted  nucleic acid-binding Zn-ribbon protein
VGEKTLTTVAARAQIEAAKATVQKISAEESSLQKTLSNIKDARPFEDLTVSLAGGLSLSLSFFFV